MDDEKNASNTEDVDPVDKEAEEKENIKKTLELMDDIYKVVKDERFHKEFNAEERHKILLEKYKDIANMYPVVLRIMARDLRYNRIALRRMLEKLLKDQKINALENEKRRASGSKKQDPLAAMRSFITHQADYAKFLYVEETKKAGRHLDMKKANKIWKTEYENMNRALKKIKEDEDRARNEFEEEKKKHLDERRKELLEFVNELSAPDSDLHADEDEEERLPPTEEEIRQSEFAELEELENYIQDLTEACESFGMPNMENNAENEDNEDNDDLPADGNARTYRKQLESLEEEEEANEIMRGMSNEDMHEYDQHLAYCRHLFDLAVKHEKLTEDDRANLIEKVDYCLTCLETEAKRRNVIAEKERRERQNEWITHLVPKGRGKASGKVKSRGRKKR